MAAQETKVTYLPIPVMRCTDFDGPYHPTTLANGIVGISPNKNPLIDSQTLVGDNQTVVAGFVHESTWGQFEEFAPAPYPLGTDIRLPGCPSIRENPKTLTIHEQTLYMEYGELVTKMSYKPNADTTVDLEVLQFASRYAPSSVCQQITMSSDKDVVLEVTTHIDMPKIQLTAYAQRTDRITRGGSKREIVDQVKAVESNRSKLGVALAVPPGRGFSREELGRYKVQVKAGQNRHFRTLASLVAELYHPTPHLEAIRLVRWAEMVGFERLRDHNRKIWAELWKSRVKITGCEPLVQEALDCAFYYLQSNVHSSSMTGYPPYGLCQNWAYYGHNFWDTDLWTLIPTVLVQPDAAKATIEYRYRCLEASKKRARLYGFKGAQYPVEAGINGPDTTPSDASTGWAEQHFSLSPAIGAWEYQLATGDPLFLREKVWPILQGVAEWIVSRGEFTGRGFEFFMMMGPDEHVNDVSNQTYFNLLAKKAMQYAIACAAEIDYEPPAEWQKVADSIYIPMDGNVVLPYDPNSIATVFDEKINEYVRRPVKMDDLSYSLGNLHWLLVHGEPMVPRDVFNSTYLKEEEIRLRREPMPGVPGSKRAPSFTSPIYMACAAFAGEREKSADLFANSWLPYKMPPFGQIREYQSQFFGSYITAFGGMLQATMFGLTGLRITDGDWCVYPATLPAGWERIVIDRILIKGKPYKLIAEHGSKAELIP